ncbi:MAG TPA: AAA family ATPase, partial [Polyangiaceae bacterium]
LGVVLYESLTGRLPFYGQLHDILVQKMQRVPPPPSALIAGVPRDLDELCVELMRIAADARPKGEAILTRLGAPLDPGEHATLSHAVSVFVGRERELAMLEGAYADVEEGRAVNLFVQGESGVGKSFLVRQFLARLRSRARPPLILAGRCLERESVPYKAVDGAVDQLSAHLAVLAPEDREELLPPNAELLSRAFPVLGRSIPGAAVAEEIVNPKELRTRMFAALRELLRRICVRRPVVLSIDDLQWADPDSLALLAEVTRPPSAPSMLVLATLRMITEERQPKVSFQRLKTMAIEGDVRNLHVGQLPLDDARMLARRLSGGEVDGAALATIVEEAGGHPLFIDELVRQRASVTRQRVLKLDDALWARVERLDPLARRLLEMVAIAGAPTAQAALADAAAIEMGQLAEVTHLLRIEHLIKTTGASVDDPIEAYHDRVKAAVLAHIDADAKTRWHVRIAEALERAGADDDEALAMHWQSAGNVVKAADYARRAADAAVKTLGFERAAHLYRRALDLHPPAPEAARELTAKLAEALSNAGYVSDAAEVNLALAKDSSDELALDLRRRASEQLLCSGRFDAGLEILRAVLGKVGVYFPKTPVAVIFSLLLARLILVLRGVSFRPRAATDSAALARADATWSAGAGFAMTDNVRGAYFQTRNLLMCLRIGDANRVSRALGMEVCFRSAGGQPARHATRALLARTWMLAREVGSPDALAMANAATGYAHYMVAEWEAARGALVAAEDLFRDRCVGVTFLLNSTRIMLYRVLGYLGDLRGLAARVPPVLRDAERQSDHYSFINLQTGPVALLSLVEDEPQKLRDALAFVTMRLPSGAFLVQHYFALQAQCQLDLHSGDGAAALGRLHAAWPALRRSLLLRIQAIRIMAFEQRGRCAAFAATGRTAARAELLALAGQDADRLCKEGIPWGQASGAMVHGAIALVRGDLATARVRYEEALQRYTALGMRVHAAATRRRLGELVGGDEGAAHIAVADTWFTGEGVKNPRKLTAVFLPVERSAMGG